MGKEGYTAAPPPKTAFLTYPIMYPILSATRVVPIVSDTLPRNRIDKVGRLTAPPLRSLALMLPPHSPLLSNLIANRPKLGLKQSAQACQSC